MKRPKKRTTIATSSSSAASEGMPSYSLSLPILLVLFVFFTILGGGLAYLATSLSSTPVAEAPTSFVLVTDTVPAETAAPTETLQPTITNTAPPPATLVPTPYTVQSGDTCPAIASFFNISVEALVAANNLSVNCFLVEGQVLSVPQPTPLPTTEALATQYAIQTATACPIEYVTVQSGDTIEIISQFKGVPVADILEYNGKVSNMLYAGEVLGIPTCKQTADAATGATYTPSPAPDYPAVELLQPAAGAYFGRNDEVILQWLASSELRNNEYFLVTIIDSTNGGAIVLEETVKDSRFIVPSSYQPAGNTPHVYSWKIGILALIGEDAEGLPVYREAGPDSEMYYFAWEGR